MPYQSQTLPEFWRCYRALPKDVREAARDAYRAFVANPTSKGLNFERLRANRDVCTVRVNRQCRAMGVIDGDTITWVWIGTHADFDRMF